MSASAGYGSWAHEFVAPSQLPGIWLPSAIGWYMSAPSNVMNRGLPFTETVPVYQADTSASSAACLGLPRIADSRLSTSGY